jgi:hypothetical protein
MHPTDVSVYLVINGLINDSGSISDYIELNDGMIGEWKEAVLTEILSCH